MSVPNVAYARHCGFCSLARMGSGSIAICLEQARGERDQEILGIELAAHAEAAADIGLQHVD